MPEEISRSTELVDDKRGFCGEVSMTPAQCNVVLEDKLGHLMPLLSCALVTMERVKLALSNGAIDWRGALRRAKVRTTES